MAKNINRKIADEILDHATNVSRFEANLQLRVLGVLHDLEDELVTKLAKVNLTARSRKRFLQLKKQVAVKIDKAYKAIEELAAQDLRKVAQLEMDFTVKAINKELGVKLANVGFTATQIATISDAALIQGAVNSDWWRTFSGETLKRFTREIQMGMSLGEGMDAMIRRVRGTSTGKYRNVIKGGKVKRVYEYAGGIMQVSNNDATKIVRTAVQTVSNTARMKSFEENDDMIKGKQWAATLDTRTCPVCRPLDGLVWDLDNNPIGHSTPFPGAIAHYQCRCDQLPVLKSMDELGLSEFKALDNVPGTKASMDGQVSDKTSYADWFNSRSVARQRDILGDKKYDLYKKGNLDFKDMVNQAGRPLTIDQLTERVNRKSN